ncbi:MAG: phytoene/squalene synthase family protein [Verrucomicrobiae bacterium]|nr:phytoene/squalene synthase family protein [Verrucomicrobiae bacterium]
MPTAKSSHLQQSFQAAREMTRQHARSFYFASFALPKKKKDAAYAVYAFCRYVDDRMDCSTSFEDQLEVAQNLRKILNQFYSKNVPEQFDWADAFYSTIRTYRIPKGHFENLIKGVEMDAQPSIQIKTWLDLEDYCYYVASVVGLIMSHIFEIKDPNAKEHAISLGIAMQLTNILRDVKEDYENHRVYLPAEELESYQVDLTNGFTQENWKKYAIFFAQRAQEYYLTSEKGISSLADDGSQFTVWIMRYVYAAILDEIAKHDYDVSVRHHVSLFKKLRLVLKAYWLYKKGSCDSRQ